MKRYGFIVLALMLVLCLATVLVACGENGGNGGDNPPALLDFEGITFDDLTVDYDGSEHEITCTGIPSGANVTYKNNKATDDGVYHATATISKEGYNTLTLNADLTIVLTAQTIVDARENSANLDAQEYDFFLNLSGTLSYAGFSGTANANYDGQYRYNSTTNDLSFKRVTSGALLYDSVEYIYNSGNSKIKVVANEDGEVKKTSVVLQQDEGLYLINLPFVAIVDHIDTNNLTNIQKLTIGDYQYKANLAIASDNAIFQKLINKVGNLGTSIQMGDAEFSNPANGIDFYFNLDDNKNSLSTFKYSVELSFPIKGVETTITLTYQQTANKQAISIPSTAGIIMEENAIKQEMANITNALNTLKNSNSYSLDLEAVNEFDPGWNTNAIVDKYFATLYKNTNDGRVDFNHSYEYKAHSEDDGAENYKYTLGNIQDGSVHLVSRKGTNIITAMPNLNLDTQFNYLTSFALVDADDIDCIKKETKDGSTFINIHMNNDCTLTIKNRIAEMINSNNADGVVDVDNHFNNNEFDIHDSYMVVEMKDGQIVNITIETEIKYYPASGDYQEEQITLNNSIVLNVNKNLDKAAEYVAPKNTETTLGSLGLNNTKYYIR